MSAAHRDQSGADASAREMPVAGTSSQTTGRSFEFARDPIHLLFAAAMKVLTLFRAMLREVFDESAYDRFLSRHQLASSPSAYGRFCDERDQSRSRRPRCC